MALDPNDWRASLPPELQTAPALKDTKDVAGLAKQFIDVQEHLGNAVRIPGKDAAPEAINEFHKKLVERVPGVYYWPKDDDPVAQAALLAKIGRPTDPKDYEVVVPKDGQEIPGFREIAHKAGLSKAAVKQLSEWFGGIQTTAQDQQSAAFKKEVEGLDAEWGAAKAPKIAAIVALAGKTGAPAALIESIQKGNAAPSMLRWFDSMVKSIGTEGTNLTTSKNDGTVVLTPKEAEKQVDEIMVRPEYKEKTPLGDSLRAKVQELAKVAWPG